MAYDARAVANYFLEKAKRESQPITQVKLQKLVYFAQGWYLAIYGERLINEQIEAWDYGPVVRTLYTQFRDYGASPITRLAEKVVIANDGTPESVILAIKGDKSGRVERFLDRIWEVYGKFSAIQLSNLSHEPDSPWHVVNQEYNGNPPRGTDIPETLIRDYFRTLSR